MINFEVRCYSDDTDFKAFQKTDQFKTGCPIRHSGRCILTGHQCPYQRRTDENFIIELIPLDCPLRGNEVIVKMVFE